MAQELEVFLKIKVENEEEARKVVECVYSGYAAEIVRLGALWGQVPFAGVASIATPATSSRKREEQAVVLQRVEDHAGSLSSAAVVSEEDTKPKPRGVAGRKRMGRG